MCRYGGRDHILVVCCFSIIQVCRLVPRKVCRRPPTDHCDKVMPPRLERLLLATFLGICPCSLLIRRCSTSVREQPAGKDSAAADCGRGLPANTRSAGIQLWLPPAEPVGRKGKFAESRIQVLLQARVGLHSGADSRQSRLGISVSI